MNETDELWVLLEEAENGIIEVRDCVRKGPISGEAHDDFMIALGYFHQARDIIRELLGIS